MRYVIGFLVSIGLLILVFVLIFRGGGDPAPTPGAAARLVDYANTTTTVQFIDDYPVTADQTHRQSVTTVGRDEVTFSYESGYEGTVIRSQSYANNPQAYANFLRALQLNGFTKGENVEQLRDERGYCANGHRYIFEIKDGSRTIQRLWSTSCGKIGTFQGQTAAVRSLFRKQVPDYNKLISNSTRVSTRTTLQ
jgi:hypothetical protein